MKKDDLKVIESGNLSMNFIEGIKDKLQVNPIILKRKLRIFKWIKISERLHLSIQGSKDHYCTPQKTLNPVEYTHMEVSFPYQSGINRWLHPITNLVECEFAIRDKSLKNELKKYEECDKDGQIIYTNVPVDLIEQIYNVLIKKEDNYL